MRDKQKVAVITDSSACVPQSEVRRLGIVVLPVHLIFGDRTYSDGVDLNASEFYERLRNGERSSTASPNVGEYLSAYRAVAEYASGAVCICVPSSLASMFSSARTAADLTGGFPVSVVDCSTAAGGQGLVTLAAARRAAAGGSLDEVEAEALNAMKRVRLVASLETLEYLRRGGRAPRLAEWGTSLLQIKPLLTVDKGEVKLLRLARTHRGAVEDMIKFVETHSEGPGELRVMVQHADVLGEAEVLAQKLRAKLHPVELHITEFTPVMGAHTGPGVLVIAFLKG